MHYAISTKVLGQTHMWYTQNKWSNFLKIFQFLWVFEFWTHSKIEHEKIRSITTSKIKTCKRKKKKTCIKQKAMHDKMHEPMILSIGSIDAWTYEIIMHEYPSSPTRHVCLGWYPYRIGYMNCDLQICCWSLPNM